MLQTLEQKYPSAYYAYTRDAHYVMFMGVRTRHETQDECLRICEGINEENGLPNVNVYRSSTFNQRKTPCSVT